MRQHGAAGMPAAGMSKASTCSMYKCLQPAWQAWWLSSSVHNRENVAPTPITIPSMYQTGGFICTCCRARCWAAAAHHLISLLCQDMQRCCLMPCRCALHVQFQISRICLQASHHSRKGRCACLFTLLESLSGGWICQEGLACRHASQARAQQQPDTASSIAAGHHGV